MKLNFKKTEYLTTQKETKELKIEIELETKGTLGRI